MALGKKTLTSIALLGLILTAAVTPAQAAPSGPARDYLITTTPAQHDSVLAHIRSAGGTVLKHSADTGLIHATLASDTASALNKITGVTAGANRTYRINGKVAKPANPGLDRIDQRPAQGDSNYSFADTQLGAGVTIYVLDSGVEANHPQFTGRVQAGASFVNTTAANGNGPGNIDCDGHGTHVAGVAAGSTIGVATKATIVPVRIFGCANDAPADGYRVLSAIDWVIDHHKSGTPAVLNMSIGSENDPLMAEAVNEAIADGITVVVAAGNDSSDACAFSPANAAAAITVGAMSNSSGKDVVSYFSNYGSCVDIFAPGGDFDPEKRVPIDPIISANATLLTTRSGDTRANLVEMVGTSQAAPFVAGAAARYLSFNPYAQPDEVTQALLSTATLDSFAETKGSPNRILYVDGNGFARTATSSPAIPTGVTATAISESAAVAVTWKAQTGKSVVPVTGYAITATSKGLPAVTSIAPAKTTSFVFNGLQADRSYRFTVTAQGEKGNSPRSLPTNPVYVGKPVTPKPAALPTAPTNLTAVPGNNLVMLNWSDPVSDGGSPILMYLVEVTPEVGVLDFSVQETARKVNQFEFWGLNSGVAYTFTVYTLTAAGASPTGVSVTATPTGQYIELPKPTDDLKIKYNNGFLSVQWPAPKAPAEGERFISSWQVGLIDEQTGKTIQKLDVRPGRHLGADFSAAKLGRKYRVSMTVVSGPLIGHSTTTKPFTMSKTLTFGDLGNGLVDQKVYDQKLSVNLKSVRTSKTVTLEWTPPRKVKVLKYNISWQDFNDTLAPWSEPKTLSASTKKYTITDMPKGVWMLRIETVTADGFGSTLVKINKTK